MSLLYGSADTHDKLSFTDVMQLALNNQSRTSEEEEDNTTAIDPDYFHTIPFHNGNQDHGYNAIMMEGERGATIHQLQFPGETNNIEKCPVIETTCTTNGTKRKRPRTAKTSEEVESQRMIHIAVERNRRKQMNEHLSVLRSLMPASYVQRGDQASIIGGAIEFVRELEQLLQCLEFQKRRRLYGDNCPIIPIGDSSLLSSTIPMQQQTPFLPPNMALSCDVDDHDQMRQLVDYEAAGVLLQEETAESKSCLADVEVKILGVDGIIKILSKTRPGQLIKTIAALEDMQLNILHTNITTIEQTVLYSFNVKIDGEAMYRAGDIANSVQQILSLIHANNAIANIMLPS
ncbi:hypothetical protein Leryth_012354 [Lithospermum erythrorhizon]|nr:hypothetical protein Leryth_012354 [Lithospermum erythrorhizon]